MEREHSNYHETITNLKIENQDLNEKVSNYCQLYENEANEHKESSAELNDKIEFLQEQVKDLEGTLEDY